MHLTSDERDAAHPAARPHAVHRGAGVGRPVPGAAPDVHIPHGGAAARERPQWRRERAGESQRR
jgi:hypothetical protein